MFTDLELRQAVLALSLIAERGNPDEFAYLLHEARSNHPASGTASMTPGARLQAGAIADRLAELLGEPRNRCEAAAVDVLGAGQQRAVFHAILAYAAELTQQRQQAKGEPDILDQFNRYGLGAMLDYSCIRGDDTPGPARHNPEPSKRPSVRIVAEPEGVA